jgi:hypothetical protein
MAILIPLTKVVLCALALPVRGRLETILMTCESAANAAEQVIARALRQSGKGNRFMQGFWHKRREAAIPKPSDRGSPLVESSELEDGPQKTGF